MFWLLSVIQLLMTPVLAKPSDCPLTPNCLCSEDQVQGYTAACQVVDDVNRTLNALPTSTSQLTISCVTSTKHNLFEESFQKFKNMSTLLIIGCDLKLTNGNIFNSLPLTNLVIKSSRFHDVPLALNSSLLTTVEISESGLIYFPDITNIPNLSVLNLTANKLSDYGSLEPTCKQGLSNLTILDLTKNNFSKFPSISSCSENIKTFRMVNNVHPVVSSKYYFNNFTALEVLDLENTKLVGDLSQLDHLVELKALKLHGGGRIFNTSFINWREMRELRLVNFVVTENVIASLPYLTKLTSLELILCHIHSIGKNTFQNMTDLKLLNLTHNAITRFSRGTFENSKHLETFVLRGNKLRSLYSGILTSPSLKIVDLSANKMSLLLGSSFDNLSNVVTLNISHNKLRTLPRSIFHNMTYLEGLFMNNNLLTQIPNVGNLKFLKYFDLKNNKLSKLPYNVFHGLYSLNGISLQNNSISFLNSLLFKDSSKMTYLDLASNKISLISKHPKSPTPWGSLTELTFLRLDYNDISLLNYDLATFKNLQYLFLDHNKLSRVLPEMFPVGLENLSLSGNKIWKIPNLFRRLTRLVQVYFQGMYPYLRSIDYTAFWVFRTRKVKVYIGNNEFNCDCTMQWLKELTIQNCDNIIPELLNLAEVPDINSTYCQHSGPGLVKLIDYPVKRFVCIYEKDQFECLLHCPCCAEAGKIDCSCVYWCPKGCVCEKSRELFRKNAIKCQNRNISALPTSFPLDSTDINMAGNNLPVITSETFGSLLALQHLFLNDSGIEHLENGCFDKMPKLTILHLDNNQIRTVPFGLFIHLRALQELYLHGNQIIDIDSKAFIRQNSLQLLTLHSNKLYTMSATMSLTNVTAEITLSENNWSCDCEFMNVFIDFVVSNAFRILDTNDLTCSVKDTEFTDFFNNRSAAEFYGSHNVDNVYGDLNATTVFVNTSRNISELYGNILNRNRDAAILRRYNSHSRINEHFRSHNVSELYSSRMNNRYNGSAGISVLDFPYNVMCSNKTVIINSTSFREILLKDDRLVGTIISLTMLCIIAIILGAVLIWKRHFVQVVIYNKLGVRFVNQNRPEVKQKFKYDAYVSYSESEDHFVVSELLPKLEKGQKFNLCVDFRDFPVGDSKADCIANAIDASHKTIIILTNDYLENEWCKFAFQSAHHVMVTENANNIVVILKEKVKNEMLDPDFRNLLKTRTYVEYGDQWFWEKLFFALPDPQARNNVQENHDNDNIDPQARNNVQKKHDKDNIEFYVIENNV